MENKLSIIAIIGLVAIAICLIFANSNDQSPQDILSVSGNSELTVEPDQAVIYVGIIVENASAQIAQEKNSALSTAVIDALKVAGIKASDIESHYYSLNKNSDWDPVDQKYIDNGYMLTHTLKVTTSDIENVGKYINAAINAGANNVNQISFELSKDKEKQVRAQALDLAIVAAREKAQSMATSAGISIGEVTTVSENNFNYMPYYANAKYDQAMVESGSANYVSPQKVDVTSSVQIGYEIE